MEHGLGRPSFTALANGNTGRERQERHAGYCKTGNPLDHVLLPSTCNEWLIASLGARTPKERPHI
jgi:hypothetical protein